MSEERQEKRTASEVVSEVAPGVLRMELPIMLPGLGHVNCYALEDGEGVTLVDPGLPDPETYDILVSRLAQASIPIDRVHTVVVTHSHPDHFGGAGRLKIMHGARIVAHESFQAILDPSHDDSVELHERPANSRYDDGFDPQLFADVLLGKRSIESLPQRTSPWGGAIPFPTTDEMAYMQQWDELTKQGFVSPTPSVRLVDENVITLGRREWIAVHTPGHTGDHLCLFDPEAGTLLSGDHVLPTITPHISGLSSSNDSLADYFEALHKVAGLSGVTNVLPAHGDPFTNLSERTDAICRHHDDRLDVIANISADLGEADVATFSQRLFKERSWGAMAESETYAHLEHLRLCGRATFRNHEGAYLYTVTE